MKFVVFVFSILLILLSGCQRKNKDVSEIMADNGVYSVDVVNKMHHYSDMSEKGGFNIPSDDMKWILKELKENDMKTKVELGKALLLGNAISSVKDVDPVVRAKFLASDDDDLKIVGIRMARFSKDKVALQKVLDSTNSSEVKEIAKRNIEKIY